MLTWHLFTNDQTVLFEQSEQTVLLQTQCLISETVDKSRDGIETHSFPGTFTKKAKEARIPCLNAVCAGSVSAIC